MNQNFPVFVDGQTLTHTELNELRDFLDSQDHALGQLIGFGIGCGLEVTLDGDTYTVSPGLAIDQLGRPIVVTEPMKVTVNTSPSEFDWLDAGADGQSVVLTLEETIEDAPDCEEDGCSRHAAPATRRPVLRVARGCVEPTSFSVETSELGGINPIVISRRSVPSNRGITMTARMLEVLKSRRFTQAALEGLEAVKIGTGELPGAGAFKAGFLNQVFFALIEYLRCEALTASACFRPTKSPGVALGCAVDGRWECEPAHHWEPPSGLARSIIGSGCEDPCRYHRARIEALILGFVLPDFPKPDDPPDPTPGGPYQICRHPKLLGGVGLELTLLRDCYHVTFPPIDGIDIKVFDIDPDIAFDPARDVYPVDELYGLAKDPIEAGTISVTGGIGHDATTVRQALIETIEASEGLAFEHEIAVVSEAELTGMVGYEPAADAAITDQIVLVANDQGMVTSTGRVPVNQTLNGVGPAVRDVSEQAAVAVAAASGAVTEVADLQGRVLTIGTAAQDLSAAILGSDGQVGLFDRFGSLEDQVATFGTTVGKSELTAELAALSATLTREFSEKTNELEILIATSGRKVREDFGTVASDLRSEMAAGQGALRNEFNAGDGALRGDLGTVETTLRSEMSGTDALIRNDVNRVQTELRQELDRSQGELRIEVKEQLRSTENRIDDVLIGRKAGGIDRPILGGVIRSDSGIVETFRAMADLMDARVAATDSDAGREAMRKVDRSVTRLEAAADLGADLPVVAGDEILAAFENLSDAASNLGAPTTAMRAVKSSITKLRRGLGQ